MLPRTSRQGEQVITLGHVAGHRVVGLDFPVAVENLAGAGGEKVPQTF